MPMKTILTLPLPQQSPGTSRHVKLHRWGEPGASPKIYIQAALHAGEIPPLLVAQHLIGLLDAADRDGAIKARSCWSRRPTRSAWAKC
jgi:predicted deacylase